MVCLCGGCNTVFGHKIIHHQFQFNNNTFLITFVLQIGREGRLQSQRTSLERNPKFYLTTFSVWLHLFYSRTILAFECNSMHFHNIQFFFRVVVFFSSLNWSCSIIIIRFLSKISNNFRIRLFCYYRNWLIRLSIFMGCFQRFGLSPYRLACKFGWLQVGFILFYFRTFHSVPF